MRPLRIAFGKPAGGRWRAGGGATVLLAVAVVAAAATAYQGWQLQHRVAEMRVAVNALDRSADRHRIDSAPRADEARLAPDQLAAANRAVEQLNLPWHDLLAGVEHAGTPAVSLVSIEPDPQHRQVRITAEAAGADAMVDYVASLARQPVFRAVVIRKHQVDLQSPYQPIRFVVELSWQQAIAGEPR